MLIRTEMPEGRKRNRGLKDYSGQKWNRLEAVSFVERDTKWGNHKWLFKCDCGNDHVVGIASVRKGETKSCGCALTDTLIERNTTHGLSRKHPRAYKIWKGMRYRCGNPNAKRYDRYGGRGISVCERWSDFANFIADMGDPPQGYSIEREDQNGNYEPDNCSWQPDKVQANNRSNNHGITHNGQTKNLAEWCEIYGIEPSKVRYRLKRGWPTERAFSKGDFRR